MFCLSLKSDDPFLNLAVEEILLKNSREEFLILSVNSPSVIIGKHQSAHREADTDFVYTHKIPVIRRISGGGTVFHDKGNLNFAFIANSEEGKQIDFRKYTLPIIGFLHTLGIEAHFEGHNDLKVDGFKISGNAEHVFRNRVLHHGTLLFNSSLEMLRGSIRKETGCYSTRAVQSNRSKVMNLSEKITEFTRTSEFRSALMNYIVKSIPQSVPFHLPDEAEKDALNLASDKYRSWEWNYAYGPEYSFKNDFVFKNINHSVYLSVKDGIIRECRIEGTSELRSLATKLSGCRHMPEDLINLFDENGFQFPSELIYSFF